jgi:microcin C transport system substrate-binding protein
MTGPINALALSMLIVLSAWPAQATPRHGLSTFGELKYPADFKHFEYVNPLAPKGGKISMIGSGGRTTFDSFNEFILQGDPAEGLDSLYDSLMTRAGDEPDSVYGLVAASADVADDGRSVSFKLRPEATFSDGSPVTAHDAVFTLTTLKEKGHPRYGLMLKDVVSAEALDATTVIYIFTGDQVRDLPMTVAELPVLSKVYFATVAFDKGLVPPVGSGPYKLVDHSPSRFVTYQRRADYWARDLPVNVGRYNFDTIRYDYFRDRNVALESLFNGTYDFREEFTSKDWALGYDRPPVKDGRIVRLTLKDQRPSGTQGFFLNTRRGKFSDVRVREALGLVYDFEWANKNLFYGLYKRTTSYFENSDLKATGAPSAEEFALLEPYRAQLPAAVFGEPISPPVTDGTGSDERRWLREAQTKLEAAGFTVKDGRRFDAKGEPFSVEFLTHEQGFDRVISPYIERLKKLGIEANIRRVDSAQYEQRTKTFDFDVTIQRYSMRLVPGIELRNYFGMGAADLEGSFNVAGIKDPVVDALVAKISQAKSRADVLTATRALDRVLRAGHYWVPHWYKAEHNLAFWSRFSWPDVKPKYDRGAPDTWWYDESRTAAIKAN